MKTTPFLKLAFFITALSLFACKKDSQRPVNPTVPVTNVDTIPYVTVCTQKWMLKNLDVDTFRNGDTIINYQTDYDWGILNHYPNLPAWCYLLNDTANGRKYGKLYNRSAIIDPRGLAPVGWHIPSLAEWQTLINNCIGDSATAAMALKAVGLDIWSDPASMPSYHGTNSSGLTFLPGGDRTGPFFHAATGESGYWWSSTTYPNFPDYNYCMNLRNNRKSVTLPALEMSSGISVRCIKD